MCIAYVIYNRNVLDIVNTVIFLFCIVKCFHDNPLSSPNSEYCNVDVQNVYITILG